MRSIFTRGHRRCAVVVLASAMAEPLLNGCSTLGIATTDELTATENRLQSSNTTTNARLDGLEKNTSDMQTTLSQMTASVDTLNARFARAKEWIESINIDTISSDAQAAQKAAMDAEARSRAFLTHYLEWLKSQQALLAKQIETLEAQMKQDVAGSKKTSKEPADSGGDD